MPFNLYFYDAKGNELSDHPLNGIPWGGSGASVVRNGKMIRARTEVFALHNNTPITAADFGQDVLVKRWHQSGSEWFDLITPEPDDIMADKFKGDLVKVPENHWNRPYAMYCKETSPR